MKYSAYYRQKNRPAGALVETARREALTTMRTMSYRKRLGFWKDDDPICSRAYKNYVMNVRITSGVNLLGELS